MKAAQVRASFLKFFADRGHEVVRSSSLVPANDPTLLFTNAGMVQFKDVFTGRESRPYSRATSAQKCVRAGGKHNDLDEVGKTARHHTFFEMLGNFSFGDYFKEDAIAWAWELLTEVWKLDPERLVVTVHRGDPEMGVAADDEAREIWRRVTGFGPERIFGLSTKENFWMMGETGPMGPCSEIHYCTPGRPERLPSGEGDPAWGDWLEIWNLVFMQYERKVKDGPLDPLPAPSIDTGAGLERVTAALQGVPSNYDTDLFTPLLQRIAEISGKRYGDDEQHDTSMRVVADHARASAFLMADGVFPEKTRREYVLRRIFRRAVRHGKLLDIEEPFMHLMCAKVVDEMKDAYPELAERRAVIERVALEEEKGFRRTLDRGLAMLEDEFSRLKETGEKVVPGDQVFVLYGTYGFPADLTEIIAGERGFGVDQAGFEREMEEARERSRDSEGGGDAAIADVNKELQNQFGATEFVGYEGRGVTGEGKVLAIVAGGARVDSAAAGDEIAFVTNRTPFYGEAGGQCGDAGVAVGDGVKVRVDDTIKPTGDVIIHQGEVTSGQLRVGDSLRLEVDDERRERVRANHSATHLLHLALKKVLGDHVAQKGSLVAPDRLRFDFAHFSPMTEQQKRQVEDWVNAEIRRNAPSETEILPLERARERGAVAMFGEKYGAEVRVVHIGSESLELCGGTHVRRSGDIGLFKIVSEAGIAQGVRRIEAVTGAGAIDYLRRLEDELAGAGAALKVGPLEVSARVGKLQGEVKQLERQVNELKTRLASGGGGRDLMSEVTEVDGLKVLATTTEVTDARVLRETADNLRDKLGSGVVVLAGVGPDKVSLVAMVTKDLTGRVHAGKLLSEVASLVDGRGGGRPDMAQGGGKDTSRVAEALDRARSYVAESA